MDMVLLDWTRMGRSYCLAGVVADGSGYRVVRPLMAKLKNSPFRNTGWSSYLMDGYFRWEIFELIGPREAVPEPPHCEDLWVRSLRPRKRSASANERQAILAATTVPDNEPIFGAPFQVTRTAAFLKAGTGTRSLTTIVVPTNGINFTGAIRDGESSADYRVKLEVPGIGCRTLPLKDHHLLTWIESLKCGVDESACRLNDIVQHKSGQVAVRLGLSRPFQSGAENCESACWLMADGFFSYSDPQP